MREKYESLSATVLRDLAKSRGIKSTSTMKKADLVEAMLAEDAKKEKEKAAKESEKKQEQSAPSEKPERKRADSAESAKEGSKEGEREEASQDDTIKNLDSGITVNGILEVMQDGFGFIRSDNNHGFGLGGFDGFRVGGHNIGPGTFLVGACTLRANTYGLFTT